MNYILGVYVSYAYQQFLHEIPNLIPNNLTGIIVQYDFFLKALSSVRHDQAVGIISKTF